MIKVDRSELNKLIESMEIFTEMKKVLANYEVEVKKLDERESQLKQKREELKQEMAANILERQQEEDIDRQVELNVEAKKLSDKDKVISTMLEKLAEDRLELKRKYVPLINEARGEAMKEKNKYSIQKMVSIMKYEMLKAIADISKEMGNQYYEVASDVQEILDDPAIKEQFGRGRTRFERELFMPTFYVMDKSVISKAEVNGCLYGTVPQYNPYKEGHQ